MSKRFLPPVPPDHDGRPLTEESRRELARLLDEIDVYFAGSRHRRYVRSLACFNMGDQMGFWREYRAGLYEAQSDREITDNDFKRLTQPGVRYLSQLRPPEN